MDRTAVVEVARTFGAQANRLGEIQQEWQLNTRSLVETGDPNVYSMLTNPIYKLPVILPDGSYRH